MLTVLADHLVRARAVLPPDVFDYYAAGSADEVTRDEAEPAWRRYRLRPWPLRDVGTVDTSIEMLGRRWPTPVAVAPTAFHQLADAGGELATGAGAAAAGSPFVLSTRSSVPVDVVGRHMAERAAPWWFQVYAMRERGTTLRLAAAAAAAGASALVLTGDTPYVGRKRRVAGVRIAIPDDEFLGTLRPHLPAAMRDDPAAARAAAAQDPTVTTAIIDELAQVSGLPVLVKGVLRGDAARECVDAGAAGIVVSTHAGRQLDRSVSSALALPDVVEAVGARVPVLVDGGIGSGLDVLIALALGARAVLVGRPVLWALAAGGAPAVTAALAAVTDDLRHCLALAGLSRADAVPDDLVVRV